MHEEGNTGEVFCGFFMKRLRKEFKKFPSNAELEFYMGMSPKEAVICSGRRTEWDDARLTAEEKKTKAGWLFRGESPDRTLQYFLEMILEELEKRFTNLLHLEVLEEHLADSGESGKSRLLKALMGEMLEREWLVDRFVKKMIREKELPAPELLIQISAQKYEQRMVETRMYFGCPEQRGELVFVKEKESGESGEWKLLPENTRAIRKMMEMSGSSGGLLLSKEEETYNVTGILSKKSSELPAISVAFKGHLSWEVLEDNQVLFEYREGKYRIPALEGGEKDERWQKELDSLINRRPEWNIKEDIVKRIVDMLKEQKHGTSIVFMSWNMLKKESERLVKNKRAYQMEPFPMLQKKNRDKIMGISAVDGAIVADAKGRCHLAGAILDGEAVIPGRPDRGARYNSLANYVNWVHKKYKRKGWCFACVLSEDETVDLVAAEGYI